MTIETETPATRTHPDAELGTEVGGSNECLVRLSVANVFNHNQTQEVTIHSTSTIGDLKATIQDVFDSKPAPQQQRLIFRGKHCEDRQQLRHTLRGLDLSSQHSMDLIVTRPLGQTTRSQSSSRANPERSHQHQGSSIGSGTSPPAGPGESPPPRIELTALQVQQLRWQYEHALWEIRRTFAAQQERYEFITGMSAVLDGQLGNVSGLGQPQSSSQQSVWRPSAAMESEVATVAATRALGGNMPGPAAGAAVRDVTGPPPEGFIPAAGLDVNGEEGRGNMVDPARAPDLRREARGYFKMVLQCLGVVIVFGIDADGWILVMLALGGFAALLYKTGLLETMLGGGQGRGGLWKALCSAATVITDGGGLLMDVRYICSAFFLSLFPTWKPKRSAEATAAETAAREAPQGAEAAAREATLAADAAAQEVARDAETAEQEAARGAEVAAQEAARDAEATAPEAVRDAEAAALEAVRDAEAAAQEAVQAAETATELAQVAEVVAAEAVAQEAAQATEDATELAQVAEVVAAEAEVVAAKAEAKAEAAEVMTVEAAKAVVEEAERTPAVIPSVQATDVGEDGARLAPSEVD